MINNFQHINRFSMGLDIKMICPICDEAIMKEEEKKTFIIIDGYATHIECMDRARLRYE